MIVVERRANVTIASMRSLTYDAASVTLTIDGETIPFTRFAPDWWESRARIVRRKHPKRKPRTPWKQRAKRRW